MNALADGVASGTAFADGRHRTLGGSGSAPDANAASHVTVAVEQFLPMWRTAAFVGEFADAVRAARSRVGERSAGSVGLTIAHASAVGLCAPQFVKDTELEGGNVAAALETFVAMMREAVQEPTLPVGDGDALQAAVEEAAGLILDSATSCRRLRKASSIKKFRDALVWYQRRLLALKVREVRLFVATDIR